MEASFITKEWLYDKQGQAVLLVYGDRLLSPDGRNLAWLHNDKMYTISTGQHIGWLIEGIMYDENSKVIAFQEDATGFIPDCPSVKPAGLPPTIPVRPSHCGFAGVKRRLLNQGWSHFTPVAYIDEKNGSVQ